MLLRMDWSKKVDQRPLLHVLPGDLAIKIHFRELFDRSDQIQFTDAITRAAAETVCGLTLLPRIDMVICYSDNN